MPRKKKKIKTTPKKVSGYHQHRDNFFEEHRYARLLLGLFIVATAIFVTMLYREQLIKQQISEYLWETEGINYYPD